MNTGSERNRQLRRVDVRFATGVAAPRRAAVENPCPVVAAGLRAVAAEIVPLADAGAGSCDLVVIVPGDRDQLPRAWRALQPEGGCWVEARLWPHRAGGQLSAALEHAGFEAVELLAPWPSLEAPRRWLPVDRRGRVSASHLPAHQGRSAARRRLHHLRLALWRLRIALRLGAPIAVVARRSAAPAAGAPAAPHDGIGNLRAALEVDLRASWPRLAPGHGASAFTWSYAAAGRDSVNKVVAHVSNGFEAPVRAVVKFARVPASAAGLEREAAVLRRLEPFGLAGVPQLLGERRLAGGPAIIESVLPGRSLASLLETRPPEELAALAGDWLAAFARSTRQAVPADADTVSQAFATSCGAALEPTLLGRGLSAMRALAKVSAVIEHRDFGPWNLLVDDAGRLQVLDWESSIVNGVAGADLVYFLTYLGVYLGRAGDAVRQEQAYPGLWDASAPFGRCAAGTLSSYLRALGLPDDLAHPIRLYTWAAHALSAVHREEPSPFVQWWCLEAAGSSPQR